MSAASSACACGQPAELRPILFSQPVCPACMIRKDIKSHEEYIVLCRDDLFQSLNSPAPAPGESELIIQHMADSERAITILREGLI